MSTNQITHHNHYVPQFYLKNWSGDNVNIYSYSLLVPNSNVPYWNRIKIKSAAVWNDFYTRTEGNKEVDDFEQWFDKEFESPTKPIFNKLLNEYDINKDESSKLSRFIVAQYLRTPAHLNVLMAWLRTEMPQILQISLQDISKNLIKNTGKNSNQLQIEDEYKLIPFKISINNEKNQIEANSIIGKGMYLFALKYLLTKTIKRLDNYKWQIIHAAEGVSFPTSDDPVICLNYNNENNYDFKGGWGKKNGNIIIPISPSLLLFTQIGSNVTPTSLDYSKQWSTFFRKIIIEHAHRYVYAKTPQKGMLAINPRRIDKVLYEKEQDMMAGWHEEQTKQESRL